MNEIRCGSCRRKLGEGEYTVLSIKCPRCGAINQLSAPSAPSERHRASNPEGTLSGKHHSNTSAGSAPAG